MKKYLQNRRTIRSANAKLHRSAWRYAAALMEPAERRILLNAPLSAVPALHSDPGAHAKLYLDFNGDSGYANWLGTDVPATPAYDIDNDPSSFSPQELTNIHEIWQGVAEKYSPFNIDVTTVDPGNENNLETTRVVIGGDGAWLGSPAGGVAAIGGFSNSGPNTCWVFPEELSLENKPIAEACAHEAGHTFGLYHHSTYDSGGNLVDEYDPGNALVAPIMGDSYYAQRGLWYDAANDQGVNVIQDDMAVISSNTNGFGYRPDDHGDTTQSATTLSNQLGAIAGSGIIEKPTDVDAFNFSCGAGTVHLTLSVAPYDAMLDASVALVDPFGTVIATSATASLGESFTAHVDGGTYTVLVSSAGKYGDVGQYSFSASVPASEGPGSDHALIQGTDVGDVITIDLVDGSYQVNVDGDITNYDPSVIKQFDVLPGDGDDTVTIGPGVCRCYILGGNGNDTLTGGDNNDTISGSAGNDLIFGGGGDDRLSGGNGKDYIIGGLGNDRLYGDAGNDILIGGAGVDRMWGGDDNDVLSGEGSADHEYGEAGNDTIYGGNGNDLLNGGDGLDTMYGNDGDDHFYSSDTYADLLNGGAGNNDAQSDSLDVLISIQGSIT